METQQAEAAKAFRLATLDLILSSLTAELKQNSLDFGDLMVYAFDPTRTDVGRWRTDHFWHDSTKFDLLMRHWLSSRATESGVKHVQRFALENVVDRLEKEAKAITESSCLRLSTEAMLSHATDEFMLNTLAEDLKHYCPTACYVFHGFCTSRSQIKAQTATGKRRKDKIVSISLLSLLHEYNQFNNSFQSYSSLFLYGSGVGRQGISVISSYGNSTSYSKLIAKPIYQSLPGSGAGSVTVVLRRQPGLLYSLGAACRKFLRDVLAAHPFGIVYDNIDIHFKVAEQVIGKIDTLESGTCATAFKLFKANPQDMLVSDLMARFDRAPPLTLTDIQLSPDEAKLHRECIISTILRTIIHHAGPEFTKYLPLLNNNTPASSYKRELHHDRLHPLPTMHIDESTVKGNIEICTTIFKELGFDTSNPEFQQFVRLIAGDQLTIARLRAIAKNRLGHESGYESFQWLVPVLGLFHVKMAQAQGILETHLGASNSSRNPVSLSYHQTLLFQKPLPTPTPFHTARDLIRVSLYGRILDCLLLVSGASDLATLTQQLSVLDTSSATNQPYANSFSRLKQFATAIYDQYANRKRVYALRKERKQASKDTPAGDMILEDSILFICEALEFEEFTAAIKAGDSGRVLIVLKLWAFSFRANGRVKYAHEMLHLIHNMTHVWPPALRDIVLNNWLINPTGKPNSHVELDLVQEHLNFWIKNAYKAHGSSASWEWLATISPCVDVLRTLTRGFQRTLGDDQGVRHASADQTRTIDALMRSLAMNKVHMIKPGRKRAEENGAPVVDVLSAGMQALVHGANSPLTEFNQNFKVLQQRRKLTPITCKKDQSEATGNEDRSLSKETRNEREDPDAERAGPEPQSEETAPESDQGSTSSSETEDDIWSEEKKEFDLEFELGEEVGYGFELEDDWGGDAESFEADEALEMEESGVDETAE
ncbi:hypothetical protein FS749_015194 [Ceratobasidium sp. UAMH 11750]|nr:hypothetical protein FS749_015194 [Ceratobasidium sp. UAMH 11750]